MSLPYGAGPQPSDRPAVKSLTRAYEATTVSDLAFWVEDAELNGAPTRERVATLFDWCCRSAGIVRALPTLVALTVLP